MHICLNLIALSFFFLPATLGNEDKSLWHGVPDSVIGPDFNQHYS